MKDELVEENVDNLNTIHTFFVILNFSLRINS